MPRWQLMTLVSSRRRRRKHSVDMVGRSKHSVDRLGRPKHFDEERHQRQCDEDQAYEIRHHGSPVSGPKHHARLLTDMLPLPTHYCRVPGHSGASSSIVASGGVQGCRRIAGFARGVCADEPVRVLIICTRPQDYAPARLREAARYLLDRRDATDEERRLASDGIEWLRSKRDEKSPPISAEVSEPKSAPAKQKRKR